MSDSIEQSISKYNKEINDQLKQMNEIYGEYSGLSPEELRKSYNVMVAQFENQTTEMDKRKDYIQKCINGLEECKNSIVEIEKVLVKMSMIANDGRIGTLHGISRQTIKENQIGMDEIGETVFNFPYNERDEIKKNHKSKSSGGKNKFKKSRGGKNKFSKTKKRRFK
jgi:hypothetical protein